MDWSRWSTNPYYALVILIVACGSIPKGVYRILSYSSQSLTD